MSPGPDCANEADRDEFTRRNGQTIYHNAGTANMGTDPMAVVDSSLKLHGLAGLRIADASVMPTVVAGNTQAAVFMIAEKPQICSLELPADFDPDICAYGAQDTCFYSVAAQSSSGVCFTVR